MTNFLQVSSTAVGTSHLIASGELANCLSVCLSVCLSHVCINVHRLCDDTDQ